MCGTESQTRDATGARRYMSPDEMAALLGVSKNTVYRLLRAGRVRGSMKVGAQWRIDPARFRITARKGA